MSPLFSRVAIVGVGLIGGSLGMAIRDRGLAQEVIGVGRKPETLTQAVDLGAIDRFTTDFSSGVAGASLIVLATPIPQILSDLERLIPLVSPDAIITDVGSIKGKIVSAGERFLPDHFVGSHPMAGSEKAGVQAGRPDLFQNATWVITPTQRTPPEKTARLQQLSDAIGARTLFMTPDAHDQAVALISHLPHVLAYLLAGLAERQAKREPQLYAVAAGSFASATRVAASSPDLWQGICSANRDALLDALRHYNRDLEQVISLLEAQDDAGLLSVFEQGYSANRKSG